MHLSFNFSFRNIFDALPLLDFKAAVVNVSVRESFGHTSLKTTECLSWTIISDHPSSNCLDPPHLVQDLSFPRLVKEGSSGGVVWYEYMTTNETVLIKNLTIWVWICEHKKDLTIASPSNSYLVESQSQVFSVKRLVLGQESPKGWAPNTGCHPDKESPQKINWRGRHCPVQRYHTRRLIIQQAEWKLLVETK